MNAAEAVERAAATGRWMVAAWRIDDAGTMHLDRVWMNFPEERIGEAVELLRSDVAKAGVASIRPLSAFPGWDAMIAERQRKQDLMKRMLADVDREILDVSVVPPKPNDEGEKT